MADDQRQQRTENNQLQRWYDLPDSTHRILPFAELPIIANLDLRVKPYFFAMLPTSFFWNICPEVRSVKPPTRKKPV